MKLKRTLFGIPALLLAILTLSGCNVFDGADKAFGKRTSEDILVEAELALEAGDFIKSEELFERLIEGGYCTRESIRGYGESLAGKAGFNVLNYLNLLQNGVGSYDTSSILFSLASTIRNRELLEKGHAKMLEIPDPDRSDLLSRGLMQIGISVDKIFEKYDTNKNGRLDKFDEIDFKSNDSAYPAWPEFYLQVAGSSNSTGLRSAFSDLIKGFNGRGEVWTFITPISGEVVNGEFSAANRRTIQAVEDIIIRLKNINLLFDVDLAGFSNQIRDLDGSD